MLDGYPRPDFGDGWRERVCSTCSAGWVGHERDGDWCHWCEAAAARQKTAERALLLDPPWLRSSAGDPRYDDLDDVGKAVWDRTRGQTRGTDSVITWAARLRRAVDADLITAAEADRALRRITR
jgi:hypothetical protein